jgi:hypothetical protein
MTLLAQPDTEQIQCLSLRGFPAIRFFYQLLKLGIGVTESRVLRHACAPFHCVHPPTLAIAWIGHRREPTLGLYELKLLSTHLESGCNTLNIIGNVASDSICFLGFAPKGQ